MDTLTLNVMGIADNGSLRNSIMEHQRTFYFRRSQSVAGYVNDIVRSLLPNSIRLHLVWRCLLSDKSPDRPRNRY